MSKSIDQRVNELSQRNITTLTLNALDFVIPGEWKNITDFDEMIRDVTGEEDSDLIEQIRERSIELYDDTEQGYQRAIWLYETVDKADSALGAAALANKVGDRIPLFGNLLSRVTPNPDKAQAIDLCIKLTVEAVAYCQINGIPGDSIGEFAASLNEYAGESIMRMAGLVCIDGLIPLGPDFLLKVQDIMSGVSDQDLEKNPTFQGISRLIPGGGTAGQLNFIGNSFDSVKDWMDNFVTSRGLSPDIILTNIRNFVEVSEDKLDYVAAFLDMTTNYYSHTGTQTVAKRIIERAWGEI